MKITQITIGRTVNLGNYESTRVELSASVEDSDEPEKCAYELAQAVEEISNKLKQRWQR